MFSNPEDHNNCYMDIQSGSGGLESQDWSRILYKMYLYWSYKKKFKSKIIHESTGDFPGGIKNITIKFIGKYAFGWLKTETGIHRLVRKSPFDTAHKRHTSFSSIFVYPEINNNIDILFKTSELRVDVYRSSGAGGQHVNRTESAVRITHIPTGTVTQCQNYRSQHKNKKTALKQLLSKLYKLEMIRQNEIKTKIEKNKSKIRWGNQIRSYFLEEQRIKDIRTGIISNNVNDILNGNLNKFIETSLKMGL